MRAAASREAALSSLVGGIKEELRSVSGVLDGVRVEGIARSVSGVLDGVRLVASATSFFLR